MLLKQPKLLQWCGLDPWPGDFHGPWAWLKKQTNTHNQSVCCCSNLREEGTNLRQHIHVKKQYFFHLLLSNFQVVEISSPHSLEFSLDSKDARASGLTVKGEEYSPLCSVFYLYCTGSDSLIATQSWIIVQHRPLLGHPCLDNKNTSRPPTACTISQPLLHVLEPSLLLPSLRSWRSIGSKGASSLPQTFLLIIPLMCARMPQVLADPPDCPGQVVHRLSSASLHHYLPENSGGKSLPSTPYQCISSASSFDSRFLTLQISFVWF